MNEEKMVLTFFLFLGTVFFVMLLILSLKELSLNIQKNKIRKILEKEKNTQVYCATRIKMNGEKYFIFRSDTTEYLVNKQGKIRGHKRLF